MDIHIEAMSTTTSSFTKGQSKADISVDKAIKTSASTTTSAAIIRTPTAAAVETYDNKPSNSSSASTSKAPTPSNQSLKEKQRSISLTDTIVLLPTSVVPAEHVTKVYIFKDVIGT